jgi:hypothetical protein
MSIYLSLYLSIVLSIYRSIYLSLYHSIYLSLNLSINQSICLSISIYLFIYRSMDLSIYLSLNLSIYRPIYLSIDLFGFYFWFCLKMLIHVSGCRVVYNNRIEFNYFSRRLMSICRNGREISTTSMCSRHYTDLHFFTLRAKKRNLN